MKIAGPDDLQGRTFLRGDCLCHFQTLISGVGKNTIDERKVTARLLQQMARSVAVLNIGWQNTHAEQEVEGVDKDVALAARDLLARIESLRVERGAPFFERLRTLQVDVRRLRVRLTPCGLAGRDILWLNTSF